MKRLFFAILVSLFFGSEIMAQSIKQKDKWGTSIYFVEGQTIRQKDKWGEALYFMDGNVLKIKDKWGAPVYYFECIPEKWIIASIIL